MIIIRKICVIDRRIIVAELNEENYIRFFMLDLNNQLNQNNYFDSNENNKIWEKIDTPFLFKDLKVENFSIEAFDNDLAIIMKVKKGYWRTYIFEPSNKLWGKQNY